LQKQQARLFGMLCLQKNLEERDNIFHWSLANGHTHFVSGIAISIGRLIANYISFKFLFVIMGFIQLFATIIQLKLISKQE
jgi:hypothetical protein